MWILASLAAFFCLCSAWCCSPCFTHGFVILLSQLQSKVLCDMLTQISSLLLLKRQVLLFPFPLILLPAKKCSLHPPSQTYLLLTDALLLTKKIQFNLQSRPKECNLFLLSGLVCFYLSWICALKWMSELSLGKCRELDWACECGKSDGGDSRCIPCFHVCILAASRDWLNLSMLFSLLPFHSTCFLDDAVFFSFWYHWLGQLLWRTNVKTQVRPPGG